MPQGQRQCPAGLGEGEGLSSSHEQWMSSLDVGGLITMCVAVLGQWLSAAAEGSRVLQAGQERASPHPPPASSHDTWTIIKMPVL